MKMVNDMTAGKPVKLLLDFSVPILLGSVFQQFYSIVDSVIVGKFVGAQALAGIGACGALLFFIFSFCFGVSSGLGILIAQYFGAGDKKSIPRTIVHGFYILCISSVALTVLSFCLADVLLTVLQTPAEIMGDASLYLKINLIGILPLALYNGISSILRALGNTKVPLYFLILASLINVTLDLLFVLAFSMGTGGVAIATVIAQTVSAIACIAFAVLKNPYFSFESKDFCLRPGIIKNILAMGIPLGIQNVLVSVSCIVLQSVINTFGTQVVAAFAVTVKIDSIVQQFYMAVGVAISAYTGQNIGAKKAERVKAGVKSSIGIVTVFSIGMLMVMHIFGRQIVRFFMNDAEMIFITAKALRVISIFYAAWGALYIYRSTLNGLGDAGFAFYSGILEVICRVGAVILLTNTAFVGVWGIWLSEGITWIIISLVGLIRYRRGRWEHYVYN